MRNMMTLPMCLLGAILAGCSAPSTVHQISTLQALMQGAYEGQVACRDLRKYGTLGIGTFDGLDGELILLEGEVYQATAEGRVVRNPPTTTPYANIVRFKPQLVAEGVSGPMSFGQLQAMLDEKAGSKNLMYAVRIDGEFGAMKIRSVPRQAVPYPPLVEAARAQRVFELKNVRGTLVGFRFPEYFRGINMPGWHLHFISDDRRQGGHVMDLSSSRLDVRLQTVRRFEMTLPAGGTFIRADLGKDMSSEIHQVEK